MFISVEKGIKAAVNGMVGNKVKEVATHPGRWGEAVIKKMLSSAPSIYVGFSQGRYQDKGTDQINTFWHVYVVSETLNNHRKPGAYQLMEMVLVALHDLDLEQKDTLQFKQVKNLFSFAQAEQGICCYELVFELPIELKAALSLVEELEDQDSLDDWLRYEATHTDSNDQIIAVDTVEIE